MQLLKLFHVCTFFVELLNVHILWQWNCEIWVCCTQNGHKISVINSINPQILVSAIKSTHWSTDIHITIHNISWTLACLSVPWLHAFLAWSLAGLQSKSSYISHPKPLKQLQSSEMGSYFKPVVIQLFPSKNMICRRKTRLWNYICYLVYWFFWQK